MDRCDQIFVDARDQFLGSLSSAERAQFQNCSSTAELLRSIRSLCAVGNAKRRAMPCLEKIKSFGDKLEPYFKVAELFCGAHPAWANVALGALRLVLQLASHFVTFFEKLCDVVDELAAKLPRYQELYDRLSSGDLKVHPRLTESIRALYTHLFEFFEAVARVFSNKCGKIRRSPSVIADLMWKPFSHRFRVVLEKIAFQGEVVREELCFTSAEDLRYIANKNSESLATMATKHEKLRERISALERQYTEQSLQLLDETIVRWLDAPDYRPKLEQACGERVDGTTEWLAEDPAFRRWKNAGPETTTPGPPGRRTKCSSAVLWLCGNPGSGKTVLAATAVNELGKSSSGQDSFPPEVCYYFFNQTSMGDNSTDACIRALAAQVFHRFRSFERIHNVYALVSSPRMSLSIGRASTDELVETILQYGIDECVDNESLVTQLCRWCESTPLRVIMASRPSVPVLRRLVPDKNRLQLSRSVLDGDIYLYLGGEIRALAEEGLLPARADEGHIVNHLTNRAEGMFLWAKLMICLLRSPVMTRAQRQELIMEEKTERLDRLEEIYERIQMRVDGADRHSRDLARRALMWAAHATLASPALRVALYPDGWDLDDEGTTEQFDHAVIIATCGLVEKKRDGNFYFIHLTALQFAREGSQRQGPFGPLLPSDSESKASMAVRCIAYLSSTIPARPLAEQLGIVAERRDVRDRWPFLEFSSLQWLSLSLHALGGARPETASITTGLSKMVRTVSDYLNMRIALMTWIESLYTFTESAYDLLQDWGRRAKLLSQRSDIPQMRDAILDLEEFLSDLKRIQVDWGGTLLTRPCEIWGDVTIFTRSRFLRTTAAADIESLAPRLEKQGPAGCDIPETVKPTFSVSMASADGQELAVLSVFPSDVFRRGWDNGLEIPCYLPSPERARGRNLDRPYTCERVTSTSTPSLPRTPGEIRDVCSGWVATYEIFHAGYPRSRSTRLETIALDAQDIEICLKQSLRPSPLGHWKCGFPLAISPDLRSCAVLNRVVQFGPPEGGYRTVMLPMDYHPKLAACWSTAMTFLADFSYRMVWSPDSGTLAAVTFDWNGGRASVSLAIFTVPGFASHHQPTLVNIHIRSETIEGSVTDCHFHPSESLFVFRAQYDIFLWRYSMAHGCPPPKLFYSVPKLPFSRFAIQDKSYKVIFSHCGTSLAIFYPGRTFPEHVALPPEQTDRKGQKRKAEDPDAASPCQRQATESAHRSLVGLTSHEVEQLPGVIGRAPVVLRSQQDNDTEITVHSLLRTSELSIYSRTASTSTKTSVLRLPQHIPSQTTSAQISLPRESPHSPGRGVPFFQIILTADSRELYETGEPAASALLPLVVRKDARSVRPDNTEHLLNQRPNQGIH
ncbi:hypothetical protein GGR56DRAFT_665513 [Xylariaceae sp. FL0804]|nr:hypothetical protein GGR56DRAFT_665513 [Xylariaceae sp. FL0804]